MIQNLNFYDIYGYLIPGLTLAVLIWLPRGLIADKWPSADWTSALVAVVIGYVVGHLVQVMARNALPSKTADGRYPSEALLDSDDPGFSEDLKTRIRDRIKSLSRIDVRTDLKKSQLTEEIRRQRRDGFLFCRDALLTSKTISYAEQMEGMYSLMNGLTVVFALGAAYYFGWALSGLMAEIFQILAWSVGGVGLLGAIVVAFLGLRKDADGSQSARMTRALLMVGLLMLSLLASGYILGLTRVSNLYHRGQFGACMLASIFALLVCFSAYKYFARTYAETIYRAFSLYEKMGTEAGQKAEQNRPDHITVYRLVRYRKH